MRQTILTLAAVFAVASMWTLTPANAEMGGLMKNAQGQCRVNTGPDHRFYYWEACKSKETAAAPVVHHTSHHRRG